MYFGHNQLYISVNEHLHMLPQALNFKRLSWKILELIKSPQVSN